MGSGVVFSLQPSGTVQVSRLRKSGRSCWASFLASSKNRVALGMSMWCPYEGVISPDLVQSLIDKFRNAGMRRHYYRIALPLREIWPAYAGPAHDGLRIEVFETWLEKVA